MRPGDQILVLDNSGTEWRVELTGVGKETAQGRIVDHQPAQTEPAVQVTLYQGTLKAQKFEWVLQKGTELGLSRFVPTICHRSVVSDTEAVAKKQARWQRIIREAAEQSGRGKLPHLETALPLAEAVRQAKADRLKLMPWEEASDFSLKELLAEAEIESVALFIGPEGGFTPEEVDLARQAGCRIVTLGPRILRAETAAIAAGAAILYELGAWQ
jgi:16S rRNA (uracil1498-N3)-methyltransferase